MIIAFAGRLHSGKSVLAQICTKYGYQRIYFALPLKEMIAHLINGTVDDVNLQKTSHYEKILSERELNYISDETKIPIEIVRKTLQNKVFHNTRDMMQIIGTDLIRKYNADWHVNKIRDMMDKGKNYVIDDTRFPNEVKMIQEENGLVFFVVRPNLEYISNHESETSLRWQMFDTIIINDSNIEELKLRWETFLTNGIVESLTKRAKLISQIANDEQEQQKFLNNYDDLTIYRMLFINKEELTYDDMFSDPLIVNNIERLENYNNSLYRVYFKNKDVKVINNPLMIEDLKFFDNRPCS